MAEEIAVAPLAELDATGALYNTPQAWTYIAQRLAYSPQRGEVLVHVTALVLGGLVDFNRDVPAARIVLTHDVPILWGNDWVQLAYPDERDRCPDLTPWDYYQRGLLRETLRQLFRDWLRDRLLSR